MGIRFKESGQTEFPSGIQMDRGSVARRIGDRLVSFIGLPAGQGGIVRVARLTQAECDFDPHGFGAGDGVTFAIKPGDSYTGPGGVKVEAY